ncbi:unnamed protein product [Rhodiola kirilowii]
MNSTRFNPAGSVAPAKSLTRKPSLSVFDLYAARIIQSSRHRRRPPPPQFIYQFSLQFELTKPITVRIRNIKRISTSLLPYRPCINKKRLLSKAKDAADVWKLWLVGDV